MDGLTIGLRGSAWMIVGTRDTAARVGSGRSAVLATPVMIGLIEEAALAAVEDRLAEGKTSLGTSLTVSHIAATPTGMRVDAEAELIEIDGRRLVFSVSARDGVELISEGRHERIVVTAESFQKRIDAKAVNKA